MPTPHFNFRLAREKAQALHAIAKLYGAPSTSEFLREMVGAMCSGDVHQVVSFSEKLAERIGGQLALNLAAVAPQVPEKPQKKGKRRRKGGKVRVRP